MPMIRSERHRGCRCPARGIVAHLRVRESRDPTQTRDDEGTRVALRVARGETFSSINTAASPKVPKRNSASKLVDLLASPLVSLTPRYDHFGARARRPGPDRTTRRGVDGGHAIEYGARASGFVARRAARSLARVRRAHRRGDRREQVRGRARPDARGYSPAHPPRPQRKRSPPRAHRRTNEGARRAPRVSRARVFLDAHRPSRFNNDPTCRPHDHPSALTITTPTRRRSPTSSSASPVASSRTPFSTSSVDSTPNAPRPTSRDTSPTSRARRSVVARGSDDSPRSPSSSNPARRCVSWRAPRACPRRGSPS